MSTEDLENAIERFNLSLRRLERAATRSAAAPRVAAHASKNPVAQTAASGQNTQSSAKKMQDVSPQGRET